LPVHVASARVAPHVGALGGGGAVGGGVGGVEGGGGDVGGVDGGLKGGGDGETS